jgi:hypothetical protein
MLFFDPALFGCACWLAGVTIVYGTLLLPQNH